MTAAVQLLYMNGQRPRRGYRDVADEITAAIQAGEWRPGDRLPTWLELGERYGVADKTIARAMRLLGERGVIVARQGGGSWVAERAPADELAELRARVAALEARCPE